MHAIRWCGGARGLTRVERVCVDGVAHIALVVVRAYEHALTVAGNHITVDHIVDLDRVIDLGLGGIRVRSGVRIRIVRIVRIGLIRVRSRRRGIRVGRIDRAGFGGFTGLGSSGSNGSDRACRIVRIVRIGRIGLVRIGRILRNEACIVEHVDDGRAIGQNHSALIARCVDGAIDRKATRQHTVGEERDRSSDACSHARRADLRSGWGSDGHSGLRRSQRRVRWCYRALPR